MEQRFNIFNLIHKALRHMLYDTALKIQRNDFTSTEETLPVIGQLELLLTYFDEHAKHEDAFILPAITKYDERLVREFESEHEEDHRLTEDLRAFITQWKLETHASPRLIWGQKIFYSFNRFVAFNLNHTNKEEKILNGLLWQHYSDQELMTIEQKIIQGIQPEILLAESRWMMRSINRKEIFEWLGGIKHGAPEEVFKVFSQIAQEELPAAMWQEVKNTFLEESIVA